jgi:hypothetical protein
MIHLVVTLLILCLVLGLVIYIFNAVPILRPFAWLANVICVVIVVIFLIEILTGIDAGGAIWPSLRMR